MANYIDANKLIAHLEDEIEECHPAVGSGEKDKSVAYGTMLGLKSAIAFAKALRTADVVEVVRCKDCGHSTTICNSTEGSKSWHCKKAYGLPTVHPTDFCSHGVRREG